MLGFFKCQPVRNALSIPIFEFLLVGTDGWFSVSFLFQLDDDGLMLGGQTCACVGPNSHFSCTPVNDIYSE
jgi:hypothetical protein